MPSNLMVLLPVAEEQVSLQKKKHAVKAAGQTPCGRSGFSDGNLKWLAPAKAKKTASKRNSMELSSDGEVEEGSWEMEEEDGSSEEMVDDYGASSSEEEEVRAFLLLLAQEMLDFTA